jgi:hypothetical protein
VVQLSDEVVGLGSLCVRKDKNMRKRRSQFTNLGRSQRAKVIKTTFEREQQSECLMTARLGFITVSQLSTVDATDLSCAEPT